MFKIKNLGKCNVPSPLINKFPSKSSFVTDDKIVNLNPIYDIDEENRIDYADGFEMAGPREKIFFRPEDVKCAIITCGGLCPGLNDVIRSIVMESYYRYGVKSITGIRYGYNGLNPEMGYEPIELTIELVKDIHKTGGTILGSSRGGTDDMELLVDRLVEMGINILYTIGGDGTQHGAHKIAEIVLSRGLNIAIIGIPKTIDNDISYIQKSFGFETAYSIAVQSISSAHVEAKGAPNGIGLVKLMGRHSGMIAANAALAMNDVNFVLIPEVPFDLLGSNGFLQHLEKRMDRKDHAVICIAEGAGQQLLNSENEKDSFDASGNVVLDDIGIYLKSQIKKYFKEKKKIVNVKYIDPSYIIRSAPAIPNDSIFCALLGQYAVHAGMAGKTDMIVGQWNNVYTHVPIETAISKRKQLDPDSRFWFNVLEATGQPVNMVNN